MFEKAVRMLVGAAIFLTVGVAAPGCRPEAPIVPDPPEPSPQQAHEQRKAELEVQFSDDFSQDYGPPDYFDLTRWTRLDKARGRTENGSWLLEAGAFPPLGPADIAFGGYATTQRSFHPGLAGTNGVEITLHDLSHERELAEQPEGVDPVLIHAWSLTVGSWHGLVGGQGEKDRGVQLHFDLLRPDGLFVYLVRGIVPEDFDRFPKDGFGEGAENLSGQELRELHEKEIAHGGVFISIPTLILACKVYRTEQEISEMLGRTRRWGLYLTDDANTIYWTLDGEVMDSVDISGYFSSSPESVVDGAFLTVMGVGSAYLNTWRMDDLELHGSPRPPQGTAAY